MAPNLFRVLNSTAFVILAIICFCLILLTPADAIYQCWKTQRLTNIFFITGAYVITFLLAVLIYATRIYTNRNALAGIPKAWIPVEKEDVGRSVRRLVMEGLARSAIISFQARPRDTRADGNSFTEYKMLTVNPDDPPWGHVEHPGWSSPSSLDLPDLPYRTVVQELPHLIEAKAVSLAPPVATTKYPFELSEQPAPDTRVVQVLRRPTSMAMREYIHRLTALGVVSPPEIGAEFLGLYERARFSAHELFETEFRELMHIFAGLLRGMRNLDTQMLSEIRGGSFRDSESVIGPSDEEGETDTVDSHDGAWMTRVRSNSIQPSNASTWESHQAPAMQGPTWAPGASYDGPGYMATSPRTPSTRSLQRVQSNASGSSAGSVIRHSDTHRLSDLRYITNFGDGPSNY